MPKRVSVMDIPRLALICCLAAIPAVVLFMIVAIWFPFHYLIFGWKVTICAYFHHSFWKKERNWVVISGKWEAGGSWQERCKLCGRIVQRIDFETGGAYL